MNHCGFRYNIYDRAPLSSIPQEKMQEFYLHFLNLTKIVRDPKNQYWLRLEPGINICLFKDIVNQPD